LINFDLFNYFLKKELNIENKTARINSNENYLRLKNKFKIPEKDLREIYNDPYMKKFYNRVSIENLILKYKI
jgi:hypothetical protein